MENLSITKTASELHVEGFPEAVKVIRIDGPQSKRLSDLTLHTVDLEFAAECLETINLVADKPPVLEQALWRAAIIHYMKCFGDSRARFQLSAKQIYREHTPALTAFNYFKDLRNKHFVHDENSYAQSIPGAILNRRDKPYKIEKIVCLSAIAETLGQDNYNNLHSLIQTTQTWVVDAYDALCEILAKELETKPYDDLYGREAILYRKPTIDEIRKNRSASLYSAPITSPLEPSV